MRKFEALIETVTVLDEQIYINAKGQDGWEFTHKQYIPPPDITQQAINTYYFVREIVE